MHGGTGGDGIAFFLFDSDIGTGDFQAGPNGGPTGYSYRRASSSSPANRGDGLKGGYLGIALDHYGNFKNHSFANNERFNGAEYAASYTPFRNSRSFISLRGARGPVLDETLQAKGMTAGRVGYPVLFTKKTSSEGTTTTPTSAYLNTVTGGHVFTTGNPSLPAEYFFDLRNVTFTTDPTLSNFRRAIITLFPHVNADTTTDGFDVTVEIQHGTRVTKIIDKYHYPTSLEYTENAIPTGTDSDSPVTTGRAADQVFSMSAPVPDSFKLGFSATPEA